MAGTAPPQSARSDGGKARATEQPRELDEPPLIEMVAGIRFVPASGLRRFALSGLVEKWEKLYPDVREMDPLPDWLEPGFSNPLYFTVGHPFRLWFVEESEHELVQLQADRLLVNWRKLDGGEYPRYPHVKGRLLERLDEVNEFLQLQPSSPVQVVRAEISCINSVSVNARSGGALERVLRPWQRDHLGSPGMPDFATLLSSHEWLRHAEPVAGRSQAQQDCVGGRGHVPQPDEPERREAGGLHCHVSGRNAPAHNQWLSRIDT